MSEASKNIYYTVCRIVNHTINGETKTGFGFFMNFVLKNGKTIRTVLTCKHVVQGYRILEFYSCTDDGNANPQDKIPFKMVCEIGKNDEFVVVHPTLDLAALIFSYDNRIFLQGNSQPCYLSLEESVIPKNENDINYIQDVLMIGFPENVYDKVNNKPIARRGLTATPFQLDFNDEKQFLLDVASFHGSSGSPVFVFNDGIYTTNNTICSGLRIYLLGIFTGGWEEKNDAYKLVECIDGEKISKMKIKLPNNLGFVLKSSTFIEMKELLEEFVENNLTNL